MPVVAFERTFQAAHRLRDHDGKCSRVHGHNFNVSVQVESSRLGDGHFVIEFEKVKRLIDAFDHRLILCDADAVEPWVGAMPAEWIAFVPEEPTTEFMAQYLADIIAARVPAVLRVQVLLRETDSIAAWGFWVADGYTPRAGTEPQ